MTHREHEACTRTVRRMHNDALRGAQDAQCGMEVAMARKPLSTVAAEVTLTLRMTDHDRALLDRLVALRAEELAEIGANEIDVTAASYLRGLIRREAKAKGITLPAPSPAAPPEPAAPSPAVPPAENAEATKVHAALLRALEGGESQASIAKRAGIDPGALSRFRKTGKGIASDKLAKLRKMLT